MTAAIIIILAIALCVACWFLFDIACNLAVASRNLDARQRVIDDLRAKLEESERIRHAVAESAMRGAPAVWVDRPDGMENPNADDRYLRVMIAGKRHDFTAEQVAAAAKRGAHFASHKPAAKAE